MEAHYKYFTSIVLVVGIIRKYLYILALESIAYRCLFLGMRKHLLSSQSGVFASVRWVRLAVMISYFITMTT